MKKKDCTEQALREGATYFMEMYQEDLKLLCRYAYNDVRTGKKTIREASLFMDKHFRCYSALKNYNYAPGIRRMVELAHSRRIADKVIPTDIAKWLLVDYKPHDAIEQEVYSQNKNLFYKEFKYMYPGGYWVQSNQNSLKLRLENGRPIEPQWLEFQRVLPLVYPYAAKTLNHYGKLEDCKWAGWKPFGIFESSLSQYGSYLFYAQEDKAKIIKTRGYREEIIFEGNLRAAFEFVYERLFYAKFDAKGKEVPYDDGEE